MSFGTSQKIFSGIHEALILALMIATVFALFYFNISIIYKIGIAVIVFGIIFLSTLATQILRQEKETRQQAAAAA
jgi:hypothetical protein